MNSLAKRPELALLLALVAAGSAWFFTNHVLVAYEISESAVKGLPRGNLSDLYPRWLGARELLLHGRDPYSREITREIQVGYYGRQVDPTRPHDPKDQQGFAYPLYVVFLLAPTVRLPFREVQLGFRWLLVILTGSSVLLWLRALRWRPSPGIAAAWIVVTLGCFPAIQGLKLQQLSLLVCALLAACAAAVASGALLLAGILLGFVISLFSLDSDLLRSAGFRFWRSDPSDRLRGWKPMTAEVERIRNDLESKLGEKLFLIADERHRASEISFYLRDKRVEGPGHPPVYLVESQDLINQFSFWPRYDQFVDAPAKPGQSPDETFTEQKGENPFMGRSALLIRNYGKNPPHNIRAAFESTEAVGTIELKRFGQHVRYWQVFLCRGYRTLPL